MMREKRKFFPYANNYVMTMKHDQASLHSTTRSRLNIARNLTINELTNDTV